MKTWTCPRLAPAVPLTHDLASEFAIYVRIEGAHCCLNLPSLLRVYLHAARATSSNSMLLRFRYAAASSPSTAAENLMRFQNLTSHLARAAQGAMKRLHPTRRMNSHNESIEAASRQFADRANGRLDAEPHSADSAPTREQRLHAWRRRVLLKKGARLHAASLRRGDRCSLAMLDSYGTVVAWYDDSNDSSRVGTHVVDRHVSQFYVAADLASNLPGLNLLSAATCGGNTQQGWRRQPSGAIIWGTTVIEAIVLKDGRLQGFSHIVRPAEGPRAGVPKQMALPSLRASGARWGVQRKAKGATYAGAAA